MSNVADILQRLHALGAEDRTWILGKLPAPTKSLLLAAASGKPSSVAPAPAAASASDASSLPTTLAATQVAAALKEEPAWLAAALLEGADDSWVADVVHRLPAVLRSDIAAFRRTGCTLTPPARQTLMRLFLAKLGPASPAPVPSRFHALLERLSASRSRKRLTLHL